jgi:polynucleotide 5'-kinase involved in rRNA processing
VDEALEEAPKSDVIVVNTRMADGAALELIGAVAEAEMPAKVVALGLAESKGRSWSTSRRARRAMC